jgi:hypothetical protein
MPDSFPSRWIVTNDGELVELGDGIIEVWGFTVNGLVNEKTPLHEFYRSWQTVDKFLAGDRSNFSRND